MMVLMQQSCPSLRFSGWFTLRLAERISRDGVGELVHFTLIVWLASICLKQLGTHRRKGSLL